MYAIDEYKVRELQKYIDKLNKKNKFDLAWRWEGNSSTPDVLVYEKAEQHDLCCSELETIFEEIKKSLPHWNLKDVE